MSTVCRFRATGFLLAVWVLSGCASSPGASPDSPVFVPGPPAEPRLQLLARFSTAADVEGASAFHRFVVGTEPERKIQKAHGVAWHDGKLYVCDSGAAGVVVFDLYREEMRPLDPSHMTVYSKPIEIAVAPDGWKYVTDTGHRRVLVFDESDRYQRAYGDPGKWKPVGIAATSESLYVTDVANHALVILNRQSGREVMRIGKMGASPGDFYYPLSVAIGPGGDIFVTDSFNSRIQRLSPDGKFKRSYGSHGDSPGQLARPRGVAVDREGRVYVVDAAFENVQIFDSEGELLLFFGGPGTGPRALNMPASVKIDYEAVDAFRDRVAPDREIEYVLFVTSQTGVNKVNVYGLLRKR